jgi:hypothetical protein
MEFSFCVDSNHPHRKSSSLKAIFAYTDIALNWISDSLKLKGSSLKLICRFGVLQSDPAHSCTLRTVFGPYPFFITGDIQDSSDPSFGCCIFFPRKIFPLSLETQITKLA